jgi:hypothetical protein
MHFTKDGKEVKHSSAVIALRSIPAFVTARFDSGGLPESLGFRTIDFCIAGCSRLW